MPQRDALGALQRLEDHAQQDLDLQHELLAKLAQQQKNKAHDAHKHGECRRLAQGLEQEGACGAAQHIQQLGVPRGLGRAPGKKPRMVCQDTLEQLENKRFGQAVQRQERCRLAVGQRTQVVQQEVGVGRGGEERHVSVGRVRRMHRQRGRRCSVLTTVFNRVKRAVLVVHFIEYRHDVLPQRRRGGRAHNRDARLLVQDKTEHQCIGEQRRRDAGIVGQQCRHCLENLELHIDVGPRDVREQTVQRVDNLGQGRGRQEMQHHAALQ